MEIKTQSVDCTNREITTIKKKPVRRKPKVIKKEHQDV